MDEVYIPISEFARLIGVSVQSVRTKKGADVYTRDTKPKTIDIRAAFLYDREIIIDENGNKTVANIENKCAGNIQNNIDNDKENKTIAENEDNNTYNNNVANEMLAMFKDELSTKNEMILNLQKQIAEKDLALHEMSKRLADMVNREQDISNMAIEALQQRNYIDEHKNILESEKRCEIDNIANNVDNEVKGNNKRRLLSIFKKK